MPENCQIQIDAIAAIAPPQIYINYKHERIARIHYRMDNNDITKDADIYPLSIRKRINTYLTSDSATGYTYPTDATNCNHLNNHKSSISLAPSISLGPLCFTSSEDNNQKIIQNTVRVPCSVYMDNLAALNVYQKPVPTVNYPGVTYTGLSWNQMSDRALPSQSKATVSSRGSSTKSTITRHRPGAGTPGGIGVDIKHNSYDRYLLRLKGKGPYRNQNTPAPVPIYGNKTTKTTIINCPC